MTKNFTLILSYDFAHLTKWHPTEPEGAFSKLTRGCFLDEDAAHAWATKEGIHRSTYEVVELSPIDKDEVVALDDGTTLPDVELVVELADDVEPDSYFVGLYSGHPDSEDDDNCYTGANFGTLAQARAAAANWRDEFKGLARTGSVKYITHVELTGPDIEREVIPTGIVPPVEYDYDWQHELAMEAGMSHGVEAYNDAMGQEVSSEPETRKKPRLTGVKWWSDSSHDGLEWHANQEDARDAIEDGMEHGDTGSYGYAVTVGRTVSNGVDLDLVTEPVVDWEAKAKKYKGIIAAMRPYVTERSIPGDEVSPTSPVDDEGDECDECGCIIPADSGGDALENKHHAQSCSLYDPNQD